MNKYFELHISYFEMNLYLASSILNSHKDDFFNNNNNTDGNDNDNYVVDHYSKCHSEKYRSCLESQRAKSKRRSMVKLKSNLNSASHWTIPPFLLYPTHIVAWQASFSKQFFLLHSDTFLSTQIILQIGCHYDWLLLLLRRR